MDNTTLTAEHNSLLAQVICNSPFAIFVLDHQHQVLYWNKACEQLTGTPAADVLGTTEAWKVFYAKERPLLADLLLDGCLEKIDGLYTGQYHSCPLGDNKWEITSFFPHLPEGGKWLAFTVTPLRNDQGQLIGALETFQDITRQKKAEAARLESQHLLNEIIESSPVPMFVLNQDHQVTHWNRACVALNAIKAEDIIGTPDQWRCFYESQRPVLADLILNQDSARINAYYQNRCSPSPLIADAWEATGFFPSFQSGPTWLYFTASPLHDLQGKVIGALETLQDITAQKTYEQQLEHQANYDPLTGMVNRNLLNSRLEQAIIYAKRDQTLLALLFIDLDNFKQVNDTFGHTTGDQVLQIIAQRLAGLVRDIDTVARMAGDEFVVLLHSPHNIDQITHIVQRLLEQLALKIPINGRELYIGASVGIALFPKDGEQAESLLKNADAAMYRAKQYDKGSFRYYTEDLNRGASQWMELKQELHYALRAGHFELYYQPQYEVKTGRLTGAEALIRWNHPTKGLLMPGLFIPIAEETGLIVPIGNWVIQTAIEQAQQWKKLTGRDVRLSVNISARQFRYHELVELLDTIIHLTGFQPVYLELELTESLVMNNPTTANQLLQQLKEKGFSLAMDDFGTGYSSLAYLRRFPFDMIKIDQSFIADLGKSAEAEAIVRAMLTLGRSLGLRMVAEGVENEEQRAFLATEGCDEIQGYLFGRPMPESEFVQQLRTQGQ